MPFDLAILGEDGRKLNNEWKKELSKHARYTVKNEYFKKQNMEAWYKKEQDINNHYRKLIKELEKKKNEEKKEAERLLKEAERLMKESEKKHNKKFLQSLQPPDQNFLLKKDQQMKTQQLRFQLLVTTKVISKIYKRNLEQLKVNKKIK